jgi:hypothetical protein
MMRVSRSDRRVSFSPPYGAEEPRDAQEFFGSFCKKELLAAVSPND